MHFGKLHIRKRNERGDEYMTIKEQVTEAVRKLGYYGEVQIATLTIGRVIVWVDNKRIGIYDIDRRTFVD